MRQAGEKRAEGARARGGGGGGGAGVRGVLAAVTARGGRRREHEGEVTRRPVRAAVPGDRVGGTRREARVGERGGSRAQGKAQFARQLRVRAQTREGVEEGLVRLLVRACRVEDAREERERRHERSAERTRGGRYRAGHVEGARDARSRLWRTQPAPPPLSICWSCREKNRRQTTLRELLGSILKKPSRARRWRKSPGAR